MATTQKVRISFSLEDALGTRASMSLYGMLDPTKTIGDLSQAVTDLKALLSAVTGAAVREGRASLVNTYDAASAALSASRVEQNALLDYLVTASGRSFGIAVPGLRDAFIVAGHLDMTEDSAPDVLADALTGNVVSSVGPVTAGIWTSNDFLALGALQDTGIAFRTHRRQLGAGSRAVATT
jgi:hypothetical protein